MKQISCQPLLRKNRPLSLFVVVSCKGHLPALNKNLEALSRQNLKPELWALVFAVKEERQCPALFDLIRSRFPSAFFLVLKKGRPVYEMRNLALEALLKNLKPQSPLSFNKGPAPPLICFIDEDVILDNPSHLSLLIETHKKYPEKTAIGGGYLDHPEGSFFGKAYNWIVRLWMKANKGLAPAGNLSLKTGKPFNSRFYSPHPSGFGGEEIWFLRSLQKEGLAFARHEKLNARHLAQHNLKSFIQRAWIHGAIFEKKAQPASKTAFLKEPGPFLIKSAALFYLLLVRLSFFWQKLGRAGGVKRL